MTPYDSIFIGYRFPLRLQVGVKAFYHTSCFIAELRFPTLNAYYTFGDYFYSPRRLGYYWFDCARQKKNHIRMIFETHGTRVGSPAVPSWFYIIFRRIGRFRHRRLGVYRFHILHPYSIRILQLRPLYTT